MTRPLRILFAGTPEIALFSLDALLTDPRRGDGFEIVAVLTNPDRPAGRRRRLTAPPVKVRALAAQIPVLQSERLDGEARDAVAAYKPDLLVSVAYGRIFGPRFLELFPAGGLNVHPSLLPRHRGPSPLQAAILAGDTETGVTIQRIALEMDSGAIVAREAVPLTHRTTVPELHDDLGVRGARLLVESVVAVAEGAVVEREQDHSAATYCGKITKDAGTIDFRCGAVEIDRKVRAYTPWPGVRARLGDDAIQLLVTHPLKREEIEPTAAAAIEAASEASVEAGTVLGVDSRYGILIQTTDGILGLSRLKPRARNGMDFTSFLNGNRNVVGTVLEQA